MKKKLLISAVLALVLVCLFAIAVAATTYNYSDEDGNLLYSATAELKANRFEMIQTESGNLAKTDADGNSLTWYVINDDNGTSVRNITVKSIKTADAGVITNGKFTFTGDVTANNVVSVNFFGIDIKTFDKQLFLTTANKTPSGSNSEYCQVANGKYLLFLYLPKTLTEIPEHFCYRTSLRVLEWEDNSVLYTTVPQNAFQYMANLKSLTIPEGIETLETKSFRECLSLAYLKFPSTMTTLVHDVFYHSIGFETVIFGENMTYIGYLNSDYKTVYNWGTNNFNIKYMYVPNTVNTTGSSFDTYRGKDGNYLAIDKSLVFLFVGTLEEAQAVANCSADRHFKSAVNGYTSGKNSTTPGEAPVTYTEYLANKSYYDNLNKDRHVLVYNVPACVAYGHKYVSSVTEPDCLTDGYTTHTCSVCNDTYVDTKVDALGHSMSGWTLTTAPVYGKVGQETNECANCDYFEVRDYIAAAAIGNTYYASFEAALANAKAGDIIVLLAPVTVTENAEYDLSGITIESAGDAFIITSGATLTLNGNFTVNAGTAGVGSWCAVWANGGHAVINGGTYSVGGDSSTSDFTHQNDLIYTKNGGTVTINGGTFVADNGVWALNENDKNRGTITVYGGTFVGFNPANNVSEGPNTSFLADGLHATANGDVYTVEAHSFDTVSSIAYANGYGKSGVKVYTCTGCDATYEETADALFMVLGYSASEAELGGITVGYKMNNEAIAEYEEITGNELVYGVFAAASEVIGNDDIFDANGNTVSGVISKEASSMKLEALNLKLVGFNTEELMAAEIVMGMYVNDGARVSYVQPEAPISGNKYHTVSYSKLPKEE